MDAQNMEPSIPSLSRLDSMPSSRRAAMDEIRRHHHGTLNLFARQTLPAEPATPRGGRRVYHNVESCETREFSWPHLRRVKPPPHVDPPHGIYHVPSAAARAQNIQVVGVTSAYKDPRNMSVPRTGIRCADRTRSAAVAAALSPARAGEGAGGAGERAGGAGERAGGAAGAGAGGAGGTGRRAALSASSRGRYSAQERFCQAVRDHAQHRRGGVTPFYVQLARGCVGSAATEAPAPTPREWRLENEPVTHTLTLAACREQLVSVVGIEVSLAEVAEILWDTEELRNAMGGTLNEEQLGGLTVTYKDFSVAFGDNSDNLRLATIKI